ncbi:MAG: glycosyltransferase [Candidatus Gracilibacteria bacterium]|jgi:glycosyltransferase involved in cell wall biosynthesis|nr:glycosyltransferase [Candidatus Gracilibacteria bacterium]
MKVALVHDFLIRLGGAERVLKVLSDMFPNAPIYTLLYDESKVGKVFPKEKVKTSFLQKYPKFIKNYQRYLTYKMPRAIEELDFSEFDLVISSSNSFAHGIITNTDTKHVCYCHSPMRYAWDWANEYVEENNISGIKRVVYSYLIKYLREWDKISADRPDKYLANSSNVQKRIKKYYGLDCDVVFPPVDVNRFNVKGTNQDYFLVVSNLTPYKKVDLAVRLFNKIGKRLVIIGGGPQRAYLKSIAAPNIDFLGFKSDEVVKEYIENCRAFIFPGEEDFGITPLEAMAAGKPVLAYGKGGTLETVVSGKTGEFFYEQTLESMEDGLARLLYNEQFYDANNIRKHAENFSIEIFKKNIKKHILD